MDFMAEKTYVVERIDGDYAWLKRTDAYDEELMPVARALLPEGVDEGTNLRYRMLEYEII